MKTRKIISFTLCLLLLSCFLTGVTAALTALGAEVEEVSLSEPARRVIALQPGDCEIIYALGAENTLVGRGEYCDWPEAVLSVPSVQAGYEINIEQILALAPELVIANLMDLDGDAVAKLQNAGIAVLKTGNTGIASVYDTIRSIGALLGKDAEAGAVVDSLEKALAAASVNAAALAGKTVYFEVSPLQWGLWSAGTGTFMDEIAGIVGLTNIFSDIDGWAAVSEEEVLQRNPDCIVTITMYYGEGPTPTEEILSRPGWENITAVKNGAILNLTGNELSRPSQRLGEGAEMLSAFASAFLLNDK